MQVYSGFVGFTNLFNVAIHYWILVIKVGNYDNCYAEKGIAVEVMIHKLGEATIFTE